MLKHLNDVRSLAWPVLLLAACLAGTPAAAQDCEVKVGAAAPMTGGASAWGLALKAGVEFQAALANEAGGLQMGNKKCRVKAVVIDGQCTAAGGAAASNYMASENVGALMGPLCSPETTGFRPVAKRHGQVAFSTSYMKDVLSSEFP